LISFQLVAVRYDCLHQQTDVAELRVLGTVLNELLAIAIQLREHLGSVLTGNGISHVDGQQRLVEVSANAKVN